MTKWSVTKFVTKVAQVVSIFGLLRPHFLSENSCCYLTANFVRNGILFNGHTRIVGIGRLWVRPIALTNIDYL